MPTSDFYSDTDPEALNTFIRLQREMPPEKKIAMALEMAAMMYRAAEIEIRKKYPEAADDEVLRRVAATHLDRETMIRAYNWDPELHR